MTSTFFPPFHLGGDATHVAMLAAELHKRGHEVIVIHDVDAYTLKRGKVPPKINETMDGPMTIPIRSSIGRASPIITYLTGNNRLAEKAFEEAVRTHRPDFVHHHNISLLGKNILKKGNLPSLYTAHDYWLICPRNDLMYRGKESCQERRCMYCTLSTMRPPQIWRNRGWQRTISDMETIISPSNFLKDRLKYFLGKESTVLPNFTPRVKKSPTLKERQDYFVFIGVLEKHKGVELILDAYLKRRIKTKLMVVGKGRLEGAVKKVAGLMPEMVEYCGYLPEQEKIDLLSGAKALLAPSIWNENSPLTCIEALSMGVPLIVTNNGGLPELVSTEKCGLIAEASSEGLESSILALEKDEPQRSILSRNAFTRYENYHTPELYCQKYLDLVKVILSA
ncbi:MAG: glycosyltransferase [Methanomassiliicoccales archaeon]|nr:glycosyltransferase [Methanomassiliicoccales archaeon]